MKLFELIVVYAAISFFLLVAFGSIIWLIVYLCKYGPSESDRIWPNV